MPVASPLRLALLCVASVIIPVSRARALDKQGSAHGGSVDATHGGIGVSGSAMIASALVNPSYAARPDNTGLMLMRYAGHVDLDLLGPALSIPVDANIFTDRQLDGAGKFAPSELDIIAGITTTHTLGPGALEMGARFEHDAAVLREAPGQTYGDVRAKYLFSLAHVAPGIASALRDGDVTAQATLGWFALNHDYFARPDNTGLAFLRYALHSEIALWGRSLGLGVDATFFTDRWHRPVAPSELDFSPELVFRRGSFDVHLVYERDMSIDNAGRDSDFVQQLIFLALGWGFSATLTKP